MKFNIYNQDCIKYMYQAAGEGIQYDLSVFSPPFSSLYTYSNLPIDVQELQSRFFK